MLSNEQITQIFFYCENDSPEGMFADDVDIFEFAKKLEAFLTDELSRRERAKCVKFVSALNKDVGNALKNWAG
jgi:hypothetical protein